MTYRDLGVTEASEGKLRAQVMTIVKEITAANVRRCSKNSCNVNFREYDNCRIQTIPSRSGSDPVTGRSLSQHGQ